MRYLKRRGLQTTSGAQSLQSPIFMAPDITTGRIRTSRSMSLIPGAGRQGLLLPPTHPSRDIRRKSFSSVSEATGSTTTQLTSAQEEDIFKYHAQRIYITAFILAAIVAAFIIFAYVNRNEPNNAW